MTRRWPKWLAAILMTACVLSSPQALAQEAGPDFIPPTAEGLGKDIKSGWHPVLKLSANFAFGQSQDVPGNPDGLSFQLGYLLNGELNYLSASEEHEWLNSLMLQLGYSRTPVVDAFIKSVDNVDLKSTYLYHVPSAPWFGPFFAFRLSTSMLPGYDVRDSDSNVLYLDVTEQLATDAADNPLDANGDIIDVTNPRVRTIAAGKIIDLTGAFAPLTLRESAGVFAIPTDTTPFRLDLRLGIGAWETFVGDGYVLEDNEDTANFLELRTMQDSVQAGPEFGILIKGVVEEKMSYSASALFMQPVLYSADTDLEGLELLNSEFEGGIGFNPWSFFSIDYSFKVYKQPLIVDAWQIQNNILLSLSFDIIGATPAVPACPSCECPEPSEQPEAEAQSPEVAAETVPATAGEAEAEQPSDGPDTAESGTSGGSEPSDQPPETGGETAGTASP